MNLRLTDEQKKLAGDNINLVYSTIAKYLGKTLVQYEDIVSNGYLGLCMAAATYDDSRGIAFSTFATKCIFNEICKGTLAANRQKRKAQREAVQLSYAIMGDDGFCDEMVNLIVDERADTAGDAIDNVLIDSIRSIAPTLVMKEETGMTFDELGKQLGISKQRACQKYHSDIAKARAVLRTV